MAKKLYEFKVGDRVRYSSAFLRNTGQFVGKAGQLRGTIVEISDFGNGQLCVIKWDGVFMESEYHDDGFGRVINANLVLESRVHLEPR